MKRPFLMFLIFCAAFGQTPQRPDPPPLFDSSGPVRMPNGKVQRAAMLKADYEKNLDDATKLARLSYELKRQLDQDGQHIVSVKAIKQTEDIEKLARNIRGRLKKF